MCHNKILLVSDFVAHAKRVLNDLLDRMVRCEVDDFEIVSL